jgi:periplasmic divalent cation tolerance protein
MPTNVFLVLSTFGDAEEARRVARTVVTEGLAACGNIIPRIESIYRWQGKVETSEETLVFFKTTKDRYAALEARIRELHSYEVPEIIAVPVDSGFGPYLEWVASGKP